MAKLEPKETATHTYTPVKDQYYVRHKIDKEAMEPIRKTEAGKYIGIPIDPIKTKAEYKMPKTSDAERRNLLEMDDK